MQIAQFYFLDPIAKIDLNDLDDDVDVDVDAIQILGTGSERKACQKFSNIRDLNCSSPSLKLYDPTVLFPILILGYVLSSEGNRQ